jgi:mRNA interferase HicA
VHRIDLEQHLRLHGCMLHHHGANHDVWLNPANMHRAPVPRHKEIKKGTARGICRMLDIPLPAGM